MVFGELKETLFWHDIPLLLKHEYEMRRHHDAGLSLNDDFLFDSIPTKEDFLARIEYYEKNGKPLWVSGRNPCCDDLSIEQLKKAYRNQFRGAERAKQMEYGSSKWATHISLYVEKVLSASQNNILELTIGAGFGTAAIVEKMSEEDFYVGVDIDYKCAKNAEGILCHYGKKGVALATSLWNLPFDNETFSVVCSHLGIDECREVPAILAEAMRVLERGGRLVLACRNSGYERTHGYFERYNIDEQTAIECLHRTRHYANRAQVDNIMEEYGAVLTDYNEFAGRYVVVYTKSE